MNPLGLNVRLFCMRKNENSESTSIKPGWPRKSEGGKVRIVQNVANWFINENEYGMNEKEDSTV